MQIRNRYYPYPVLMAGGDGYENSSFYTSLEQEQDGYNIRIRIESKLDNAYLQELITNGIVAFAHHVECADTCFRKVFLTVDSCFDLLLKDGDVNGTIQICSFIVAVESIKEYENVLFASQYKGFKFNIESGCILAIGDSYNVTVEKIKDDLSNTSSIFSIVPNDDPTASQMSIDLGQQKIVISLPRKTHSQYRNIQTSITMQPIMHSMIIVPALVYVLSTLKTMELYELENHRWYRSIVKACSGLGYDLNEDGLKNADIFKLAQQLVNNPIVAAIAGEIEMGDADED